jgi:hypothetical protein
MKKPKGVTFVRSTAFEDEIIKARMEEDLPALVHLEPVTLQRYFITANPDGTAVCWCETNDDDDDGYPDGAWEQWEEQYPSVEKALDVKGKCHVGISGVIVTVLLDGKEVR